MCLLPTAKICFLKIYLGTFSVSINIQQMAKICPNLSPQNYVCEKCQYITVSNKDFNKHLLTRKHKNTTKYNQNLIKIPNNTILKCSAILCYSYQCERHLEGLILNFFWGSYRKNKD